MPFVAGAVNHTIDKLQEVLTLQGAAFVRMSPNLQGGFEEVFIYPYLIV